MMRAQADLMHHCADAGRRLLTRADGRVEQTVQPEDDWPARKWLPQSLSRGAAGIALAHAACGDPSQAHRWLTAAVARGVTVGDGSGLWFGAPAVAIAAATSHPDRYGTALARLDTAICRLVRARLDAAESRLSDRQRPRLAEFDLVHGLTGLGAYLLVRDPGGRMLPDVLAYLVRLTEPLPADDHGGNALPGWWTDEAPSLHSRIRGHGNLGMAHGITGPLALLCLAARRGLSVPGHLIAIDRITSWLDAWQQHSPAGVWWPKYVDMDDVRAGRPAQHGPARPSWCYGTPGISRALQLAGIVRGDRARQQAAEEALARCVNDPAQLAELVDPYLCHGWAGVVATVHYAAADACSAGLAAAVPRLTTALLKASMSAEDRPPGLITGTDGVGVALHSVACATTTPWPACLLIN
jgi:hypothetical protein